MDSVSEQVMRTFKISKSKRGCSPQGSVSVCAVNEANHSGCSYLHIRFLIKLIHQSINPRQQHVCCAPLWQSGYVLATLFQLSMSFSFTPPLIVSFPLHSVLSLSPVSSVNSFTRFTSPLLFCTSSRPRRYFYPARVEMLIACEAVWRQK